MNELRDRQFAVIGAGNRRMSFYYSVFCHCLVGVSWVKYIQVIEYYMEGFFEESVAS